MYADVCEVKKLFKLHSCSAFNADIRYNDSDTDIDIDNDNDAT